MPSDSASATVVRPWSGRAQPPASGVSPTLRHHRRIGLTPEAGGLRPVRTTLSRGWSWEGRPPPASVCLKLCSSEHTGDAIVRLGGPLDLVELDPLVLGVGLGDVARPEDQAGQPRLA